ncbi:MAG: hypothetical protein D3926_11775 [Desulfobacteraceae bacterium]|nr:MAG: hypothetical protein D3926_11775 [Desulfobacteraceae bacterium]
MNIPADTIWQAGESQIEPGCEILITPLLVSKIVKHLQAISHFSDLIRGLKYCLSLKTFCNSLILE